MGHAGTTVMRALPALATLALLSSTLSSPALARPCQSALPEAGASARLGFAPAGFGSVPEACPVTDSSLQGTASALLAFDDFYGLLEAGVAPRFRRRLFDSDWVSLWLPSLEYRFSANATIEAHTLGLGDAAVGYHHALAVNQRLVLTPYLRVLYPFDTGYRNATRYGFEHGLSASLLLSPRIELVVDVEQDLAAAGDPTLLRQVMIGLLTNAFKNTPPPGTVTLRGRHQGVGEVVLEVIDTGTGIPGPEIERVFERFYRRSESRKQEGFGLGLAIARRMVDVMGGTIGAESVLGEGSTFWVRLPLAQPSPTPIA